MIAPVFLSASEPKPDRNPEYWDSRSLLNLREAVRAFCAHVLPNFPVVFGGHPAITPLVRGIAERVAHDLRIDPERREKSRMKQPQVVTFQSRKFVDRNAEDDEVFTEALDAKGEVAPPKESSRRMSLLYMRYEMIGRPEPALDEALRRPAHRVDPSDVPMYRMLQGHVATLGTERRRRLDPKNNGRDAPDGFSAAVFIGGMEGVEREFRIFRCFHADTPALPIASTGSACKKLLDEVAPSLADAPQIFVALRDETVYSLLMQQILPVSDRAQLGGPKLTWHRGEVPPFRLEAHADPENPQR